VTDSFFTSRNGYDENFDSMNLHPWNAELIIEAATRRIVKLKGPICAAERLQRIADLCAVANVLPPEHWRKAGAVPTGAPTPAEKPPAKHGFGWRIFKLCSDNPAIIFWFGFILGCWYGGLH